MPNPTDLTPFYQNGFSAIIGAVIIKLGDFLAQRYKSKDTETSQFRKDLMKRNTDLVEQIRLEREAFALEKAAYARERESLKQEINDLKMKMEEVIQENIGLQKDQLNLYRKVGELELTLGTKLK